MDVMIAGAGPTGLALACGLRAAGVPVEGGRASPRASAPLIVPPRGLTLSGYPD